MIATIFNMETTTLVNNRSVADRLLPHVIDICFITVDLSDGQIQSEYETLINPGVSLDRQITYITKLTDEMLSAAPRFANVAESIERMITSSGCLIARNAALYQEVIDIEFSRLKRTVEWLPLICMVEQTQHLKSRRLGLSALHEYLFSERYLDAHRARPDAEATLRCAIELHKRGTI